MEVLLAKCAGACYGVQRALKLARSQAENGVRAQTLGPLIHNPRVVQELSEQGISVAERVEDVNCDCVIVRSHGVTPEMMRDLESKAVRIVNATCPHVLKAQEAARELAKTCATVIIVGESSHPEVEGLRAHAQEAGGKVLVCESAADLPQSIAEPVGIVVQTTQSRNHLHELCDALKQRGINPVVKDTICSATGQRQREAAELASQVDAMVVIGGHNSANTTRLFEICSEHAPRAFHVESAEELSPDLFENCTKVGVTAGASTPQEHIEYIVRLLEQW